MFVLVLCTCKEFCVSISRLKNDGSNLIQDRKYHLKSYKQCFVGKDFVDWLIARGEATNRADAIDLGKQFVEAGVISHGKLSHGLYVMNYLRGRLSSVGAFSKCMLQCCKHF